MEPSEDAHHQVSGEHTMHEGQYQAQLLRIDDLRRAAAEERQARRAVTGRRRRQLDDEAEGRVRRHTARWTKAA
ncbi:hypothetical protein LHJ74_22270 [Streptomyces sp. N2-109]|uniref:Uncharacterized protein n=1 Tax=Streptomyces gossypii TaxID=2883101 RepID=A0ABT2JY09_9ACTN|nr:hypothetical protein [Streptomyces gossypii]MCT2592601.1 hypothetical protein [Streptomyces gossypii]